MMRFVVDSSVVIKWYVPEVHSAESLRYLDPALERHAPELLLAEIANILWKKVGRGEIAPDEAARIADGVRQAAIAIHPMGPLFGPALAIALDTGRSAYDCLYLALADILAAPMVTADRRLYNALQGSPYAGEVLWIEDGP
jgi:predicted nucleic acid-binding protein